MNRKPFAKRNSKYFALTVLALALLAAHVFALGAPGASTQEIVQQELRIPARGAKMACRR
jgi:hypothetical protein